MKAICILPNHGRVIFSQSSSVKVEFDLTHFGPNETHAIHIHEFGDLSDGCKTLGLHYNPENVNHGCYSHDTVRHSGDLINNFKTDKDGNFKFEYNDDLLAVNDILGRSVVIHEGIDDCGHGKDKESLISGNAGKRIVCGVIGRMMNLKK